MKKVLILTGIVCSCNILISSAQTKAERARITQNYDQALLSEMAQRSARKAKSEKEAALVFAKKHNIPLTIKHEDGSFCELMRIQDNLPVYYTTYNTTAARSTRTNYLNTGGALGLHLNGQNMTVGVWDGGAVRPSHRELSGHVTIRDNSSDTGTDHATHVGGTIAASGVTDSAKGMAGAAHIYSSNWNNDISEMTTEAATGLLVSNHSYGPNIFLNSRWYRGAYSSMSRDWDDILFNAPYYTICKAAGNDGKFRHVLPPEDSTNLYDKLLGSSTAKNVIVVANAEEANIDSNGNLVSVLISPSSSQGPTDDLRIKPDIAANGTTVYSSFASSDSAYASRSGTSMAAPNVAGSLILIQQHYKNLSGNFLLGAALKGLALHTADDAGPAGPDAHYGWGLLNAKKMAEVINTRNTSSLIANKTLANQTTDSISINSDGIHPLSVSISWYDRSGPIQTSSAHLNDTTKRLVNNLDLRVAGNGVIYKPWALTSKSANAKQDNNADNYERIDIGVVPAGTYNIAVSHKGSLTGGSQTYTLIVTGKSFASGITVMNAVPKEIKPVSVHPNPADNLLNVFISEKITDNALLKIFDLSGKEVVRIKIHTNKQQVDISRLPAGLYHIKVQNGGNQYPIKFTKK